MTRYFDLETKLKAVRLYRSRKGNCYDNAMMESFFGTMKTELLYTRKFKNIYEFADALSEYDEYYNNKRIKLRLGTSPMNYRTNINNILSK